MPFATPFTRLTMEGTLAGGNEIWSSGLSIVTGQSSYEQWNDDMTPLAAGLATACEDFISNSASLVPTDVVLTNIKLAAIGTDGKYQGEAIVVPTTANGPNGVAYVPQNAIACTLVSDKFRDPGKYNRFYLPTGQYGPSGKYELTSTDQGNLAGLVATFVGELNDVLEGYASLSPCRVSVVSSSGTGVALDATSVMIGQVIDTQRRRRNKLNENYVTEPVIFI